MTGLPGSGKSFTGEMLATRLNYSFFDLDKIVEQKEGTDIPSIFKNKGEDAFRVAETKALKEFIEKNHSSEYVMALGGGCICFHNNLDLVLQNGVLIFLNEKPTTIAERIIKKPYERPMFAEMNREEIEIKLEELSRERCDYYHKADIIINPSDLGDLILKIEELKIR